MIDKDAVPTKLLWVDLEMTGLDPTKHVIIEIAAEITDFNFKTLGNYEALIKISPEALEQIDEWSLEQHTTSGLLERLKSEGREEAAVIHEFANFIRSNFGNELAVLAGNSIHNDRRFIRAHWPEVEKLLFYRMLDVSAWKVLMQGKYGVEFEKNKAHRAFDDIQASIAELQHYLEWFKKDKSG